MELPAEGRPLEIGKGRIMREGSTVALLSLGTRLGEALSDKARSGVRVRVLLDAWGASSIDPSLISQMEEAGVIEREEPMWLAAAIYHLQDEHIEAIARRLGTS